jgi:hypothetical protein
MYVIYILLGVGLIAVVNWLWLRSAPPKPPAAQAANYRSGAIAPALVPKTGLNLPPTVSKPVEPLRNQIVNLKWRINQ